MANQVTLTFAGDGSKLAQTFDQVGASADGMRDKVGSASRSVAESAEGFDRAGEAADGAEGKSQGFSDTLTGTKDLMDATGEIAKGNYFEGLVLAGQGGADLAGGLASFVIPAVKNLSTAMIGNALQAGRAGAAFLVQRGAALASAVGTGALRLAQLGLNAAMRANPIGLVVTALLALVAGAVWAYKNVGWFRNGVDAAMRGVRTAFSAVVTAGGAVWGWFQKLPGRISGAFKGLASIISSPFSTAFNAVRNFWNNTLGGKGFSIPDWVPEIGGASFSIPRFHSGGIMPGAPGSEGLALLQAGERITPAHSSGQGVTIEVASTGSALDKLFLSWLKGAIRVRGGDVVQVLGS